MTKTVAYHWHLRKIMNEHGMNATTELVPLLADRGVVMTSTQVYRIVTGEPERLNMRLLAALCDILDVTPNDLIAPLLDRDAEDWAERLGQVVDKKFGPEPATDPKELARRARFLEYRGFPPDLVRRYLRGDPG